MQPAAGHALLQRRTNQEKVETVGEKVVPTFPDALKNAGAGCVVAAGQTCYVELPDGNTYLGQCGSKGWSGGPGHWEEFTICTVSAETSGCNDRNVGQGCRWLGFSGTCAEVDRQYGSACDIWLSGGGDIGPTSSSCPASCERAYCVAGGAHNGGVPLTNGKCTSHCSKLYNGVRYCGSGTAYTASESVDCTSCAETPSTCPSTCESSICGAGGVHNGGLQLTQGKCTAYCSQDYGGFRYCGSGTAYTSGDSVDCRGCATEPDTPTPTPTPAPTPAPISSHCPSTCHTSAGCGAGGAHNGGESLSNGWCMTYCSKPFNNYRYCGTGPSYTTSASIDCRGCAVMENAPDYPDELIKIHSHDCANAYAGGQRCSIPLPDGTISTGGSCHTRGYSAGPGHWEEVPICELAEASMCGYNTVGHPCFLFGFTGRCTVSHNKYGTTCDIWQSMDSACDAACQDPKCTAGGAHNGGKQMTDGKCVYHCSKEFSGMRYCGTGSEYTTGASVDCSGCR